MWNKIQEFVGCLPVTTNYLGDSTEHLNGKLYQKCLPLSHFYPLFHKMLFIQWFYCVFSCFILFLSSLLTSGLCKICQMCSHGPWNQVWVRPGAEQEGDPYLVSEAVRIPTVLRECHLCLYMPFREQKIQGTLFYYRKKQIRNRAKMFIIILHFWSTNS